ncbi:MAG: hypothetical protein ACRDQ5_21575, partial [Sciscionella sp.]
DHRLDMSLEELKLVFPALNGRKLQKVLDNVLKTTGRVPLQVSSFFDFGCDLEMYRMLTTDDMKSKVKTFRAASDFKDELADSAISCLLGNEVTTTFYDRNFCVLKSNVDGQRRYECLFPLVADVLQEVYWDEVLKFVSQKETKLLRVCSTPGITNDVRGRTFEFIVINRCITGLLIADPLKGELQERNFLRHVKSFGGKKLPEEFAEDGVYVPKNPNFPAVDMIWKAGNTVWGVQMHVAKHTSVLNAFIVKCKEANWNNTFDTVHLLYISPEREVKELMHKVDKKNILDRTKEKEWCPTVLFASCEEIACLKTIRWPKRCSIR